MAGFRDENYENLFSQAQRLPEALRGMMGGVVRKPEPAWPVLQPLQEWNRPDAFPFHSSFLESPAQEKKAQLQYYKCGEKAGKAPFTLITWLGLLNAKIPVPIRRIYSFVAEYFPGCITPGTNSWEKSLRECASKKANKHLFDKVKPGKADGPACFDRRGSYYWTIKKGSRRFIEAMLKKLAGRNINQNNLGLANTDDWEDIFAGTKGLPEGSREKLPEELNSLQIRVPEEPSYEGPTGYELWNQYVAPADGVIYAEDDSPFTVSQPSPAQVKREQSEMQLQEAIPHYVKPEPLPSDEHLPDYDPWDQYDDLEQYGAGDAIYTEDSSEDQKPFSHPPGVENFSHQPYSSAKEAYSPFYTNDYKPFDNNDYTIL